MKPNPRLTAHKPIKHGGIFSISKPDPKILDFSSNINPLGPGANVHKTIKENLETLSIYPDPESTELRRLLQKYTQTPLSQVVIGNGATELIYNFCNSFLSKKTPVLIPIPTFGEYEAASKLSGATVKFFKTMDLNNDLKDFISKIPRNGCIFICNPNNPTGKLLSKNNMKIILDSAKKKNTMVFVDECFIELVPKYNESIISFVKNYNNLFILRSLTKSFGLAGIRIGYGLGSKKIISILNKIKIPWNVSGLAQHAAIAALSNPKHLDKAKKIIQDESNYLTSKISKLSNFECTESSTNFILIKSKINSQNLQKKLLKKKILVRDCSNFRGLNKNFIRIAVKTRKQNQKLVKALEEL
ncbi:MAG: threonine-phosphate decarboxylase [Nitrososphaeria archaeon]|nr:threonine-phosphate decarboxylase [Nitrosopumilaceae archaeon]NIP10452.1 threonine-phosphate decarboxylase [Nitrosopumilaceae archaeon]NIP90834.1 threonine-phosphate decarboxylase [Nitrososphaeria archaeon]NIS95095.1 threonine-phosphate decarboxylase [Nitrosopumilaceae archaeon]